MTRKHTHPDYPFDLVRVLRYKGYLLRIYSNGYNMPYEWCVGHSGDGRKPLVDAWPYPGRRKRLHDPTSWSTIPAAIRFGKDAIDSMLTPTKRKPIFYR